MNLLSNSNKFQSNATIDVTVSMDQQKKEFLIEVRDHGVGIRKKDQEKLFTPFAKIENGNLNPNGVGLGLSIC
jgi:K+-sensing histidine kinase KdpD